MYYFNTSTYITMKDKISEQRIALLHPAVKDEILTLLNKAEDTITGDEVCIRVVQGLRTIAEQNDLYAQGRTKPGAIVTNAPGGKSAHNYGLAIDICWLWKQADGTYKYDDKKAWLTGPKFMKVVDLFKSAGYTWGGDWTTIKDTPHFEKMFGYTVSQLKAKYDKHDFQQGTEYVTLTKSNVTNNIA